MVALPDLGPRILILGTSNSGKSTLAVALSERLGVPVVHLDQLRQTPQTDWEQRPEAEFAALHDAAIAEPAWVMDGNYAAYMPQRFDRATGAILLSANRWIRFARYLKRTLRNSRARAGHLDGAKDSVKWSMVHWILVVSPGREQKFARRIKESGLPHVICPNPRAVTALYADWGLTRPT